MSRPELSPVSYVVLGLVARDGPSTPYALKAAVARGIAQFWAFPHSQIYAETDRLARMGLLAEERESSGRRRRSYRITDAGRAALASWLAQPTGEAPQIRSLALLKLFFGQFASEADLAALARAQLETQRRRLEVFRGLIERLEARGDRPWQLEVAHLLHQAELSFASSWTRISELVEERPDAAGASG